MDWTGMGKSSNTMRAGEGVLLDSLMLLLLLERTVQESLDPLNIIIPTVYQNQGVTLLSRTRWTLILNLWPLFHEAPWGPTSSACCPFLQLYKANDKASALWNWHPHQELHGTISWAPVRAHATIQGFLWRHPGTSAGHNLNHFVRSSLV